MDIRFAMHEQEKQLVNQGITTMYHSLTISNVIGIRRRNAARGETLSEKLIQEVVSAEHEKRLIRHKLHIRFDITFLDGLNALVNLLNDGGVSLLSFMDHTPGQGQYRDLEKSFNTMRLNNPGLNEKELAERMERRMKTEKIPHEKLIDVAKLAKSKNVSIASHDDDCNEKVDFVKNMLNASISEFPVDINVARYAASVGLYTIGGAPNVVIGRSHSGNMSAAEGILDGCISVLCSDYHPPSMLHAVFKLNKEFGMQLNEAVKLVSTAPARAVGIDNYLGSVSEGKTADLILVDASAEFPRIVTVLTDGKIVSTLNYPHRANNAASIEKAV